VRGCEGHCSSVHLLKGNQGDLSEENVEKRMRIEEINECGGAMSEGYSFSVFILRCVAVVKRQRRGGEPTGRTRTTTHKSSRYCHPF
jgi:hypothetical protein